MKKLLYTLLAVSIIFSACEEEDAVPTTNNNNSSACGNVGMTINSIMRAYSPMQGSCISQVQTINGQITSISLSFISNCNNMITDYSLQVSTLDGNNLYEATFFDHGCSTTPNTASTYLGSSQGEFIISDINYSNYKISGSFNLIGLGKPTISCTFSNVPFTLMAL